jgi:hypothetical protein
MNGKTNEKKLCLKLTYEMMPKNGVTIKMVFTIGKDGKRNFWNSSVPSDGLTNGIEN